MEMKSSTSVVDITACVATIRFSFCVGTLHVFMDNFCHQRIWIFANLEGMYSIYL